MYTDSIKRNDSIVEEIRKATGITTGFADTRRIPGTDARMMLSTDGVGTKMKIVAALNDYRGIGQDLVAMCVNDIIASGGVPKYFQNYIGINKINADVIMPIIKSINDACKSCGVFLTGGETAELKDTYIHDYPELVGFAVGFMSNEGAPVNSGDIIVGLPSNGLHSNGFTVVNRVLGDAAYDPELLAPTKIYRELVDVYWLSPRMIKVAAHITGGGLEANIGRSLVYHDFIINRETIQVPEIFKRIQKLTGYSTDVMYSIFNMGIGMTVVINKENFYPLSQMLEYEPPIIGVIL